MNLTSPERVSAELTPDRNSSALVGACLRSKPPSRVGVMLQLEDS